MTRDLELIQSDLKFSAEVAAGSSNILSDKPSIPLPVGHTPS